MGKINSHRNCYSFFSVMFPTVKKKFLIKCLTAVFNELQINSKQPLAFLPKESFHLVLTNKSFVTFFKKKTY